jgi:hypothetical protein
MCLCFHFHWFPYLYDCLYFISNVARAVHLITFSEGTASLGVAKWHLARPCHTKTPTQVLFLTDGKQVTLVALFHKIVTHFNRTVLDQGLVPLLRILEVSVRMSVSVFSVLSSCIVSVSSSSPCKYGMTPSAALSGSPNANFLSYCVRPSGTQSAEHTLLSATGQHLHIQPHVYEQGAVRL